MARNRVEYYIQEGAFHTFKVNAGETLFVGQPVAIRGDMTVGLANAGEEAIGIVYSGSVGKDGVNEGYKGDEGDVVTIVMLKPLVYLTAGGPVPAGSDVVVGDGGKFVAASTDGNGEAGAASTGKVVAKAVTSAAADGEQFVAILK